MDITYRPAKPEDLAAAERVAQQSGNALRVRHGGRPSPAPPSIAFPEFCLAQDPAGLWVAEDGDAIVGFGFSWMTEQFWCLSQLFVRPETQAKGIGQALLSKTLMQAERNGAANRALIVVAAHDFTTSADKSARSAGWTACTCRVSEDATRAEEADCDEPYQHHRPEDVADERSPFALDQKQTDKDRDAGRNHERREPGASSLRPSTALSTEIAGVMTPSP